MSQTPVAPESTFEVPELEIPAPRPTVPAPMAIAASEIMIESGTAQPRIELDRTRRATPRFVTGAAGRFEPEPVGCPYCGVPRSAHEQECASCGYRGSMPPASRLPSSASVVPFDVHASSPSTLPPQSRLDVCIEALTSIPWGFWKRLPVYAFLVMVLGNGCRCGGLSTQTNVSLVLLILVGLAGVAASLHRSP